MFIISEIKRLPDTELYDEKTTPSALLLSSFPVLNSCKRPVDPAVEARLKQEVAAFNSNSTKVTGNGISMDSASTSGAALTFNFTLHNNGKTDFDSLVFARQARQDVFTTLEAGGNSAFFRDHHIEITYNYYDRNGVLMSAIVIEPGDYSQD